MFLFILASKKLWNANQNGIRATGYVIWKGVLVRSGTTERDYLITYLQTRWWEYDVRSDCDII